MIWRQEFRQDAVFGRRIHRRTDPDDHVSDENDPKLRVAGQTHEIVKEDREATDDLDRIGEEHHPALGARICKRPDECREHYIGHREPPLDHGRHPRRTVQLGNQRHRGDEQRIVRQRTEKLRRHDCVKAAFHWILLSGCSGGATGAGESLQGPTKHGIQLGGCGHPSAFAAFRDRWLYRQSIRAIDTT